MLGGEVGEGEVGGDAEAAGGLDEVLLRLAIDLAFPAFERAVVDGLGAVGDGEAVVDLDDATETAAGGAGAKGGVEGEERGGGGAETLAGGGGVKAAGERADGAK